MPGRAALVATLLLASLLIAPRRLAAQEAGSRAKPPSAWKRTVELAGSLFLGNKPQTVLTTRGRASHADSTYELGADFRFIYGSATEDGNHFVSQRSWLGALNLDFWPHARQSPFLLGTVESSLERRIDLRTSGGVGHKITFADRPAAGASLSLAVLGERTRAPTARGRDDGELAAALLQPAAAAPEGRQPDDAVAGVVLPAGGHEPRPLHLQQQRQRRHTG